MPTVDSRTTEPHVRTIEDLPGPKGLPVLGNLPEYKRGGKPHRALERWCDRFGPTFRVKLAYGSAIVTADPEIVETVLRERPDQFRRSRRLAAVFDELGARGVFNAEGDEWRRLRKLATHSLGAPYLRQYFTTITRTTGRLVGKWDSLAVSGQRIDVLRETTRFTLDVTAALAMGHDLNSVELDTDGLHRRLPLLFPEINRRANAMVPYWRHFKLPRDRRVDKTLREIASLVSDKFAEARLRMAGSTTPTNFLEALVLPVEDEPPVTPEELLGNMVSILLAGEDTTSATATWVLHFLAEHPEVQERVAAEAAAVLGEHDLPPDVETLRRLVYAAAVVDESIRLRPVAPMLIAQPIRETVFDTANGTLSVAAGTPLFLLTGYGARRDPRFPDPERFVPERWLGPTAAATMPFAPFGSGPRFCPGRNLALVETTMLAAVLSRRFHIEPDHSAGPVDERVSFTVYPVNVGVRLRPRTAHA